MHKQVQFKTVGMNRDTSESAFNPKFAYENKNIRIVPTDDNTLFSIVNEKGNKHLKINGIGDNIQGTPIGQAVVDNEWILFTTIDNPENGMKPDYIYKIWFNDNTLKGKVLYSGFLNFSVDNPIETLVFYENNDIKKVYWVDGRNQPRFINIAADNNTIIKWRDNPHAFDFVTKIKAQEKVTISRNSIASGLFASGVLQYVFTYYNKYGQESNIVYQSPLYYTSYNDRGASPEDNISNSFDINIKNVDTSFDYIRIYSIHRSSLDSTPEVKRVVDLSIADETQETQGTIELTYTDTGTSGDIIDPTLLLYIGGEEVVFNTLTQKDNTLFLGDFSLKRKLLDNTVRDFFKRINPEFKSYDINKNPYKTLTLAEPFGYYPYNNQLKLDSDKIKTFKYLEWYRIGIQAQHYTGKWSEPIWIKDIRNEVPIETTFYKDDPVIMPVIEYVLNDAYILQKFKDNGYIKIRPVIVYPTLKDREVICQGVLCPTVYSVNDRSSDSPFAQSSWFIRPNIPYNADTTDNKYFWNNNYITDRYSKYGIVKNGRTQDTPTGDTIVSEAGAWVEFRHNKPIPGSDKRNSEVQCIYNPPDSPSIEGDLNDWISSNGEYYFIDQNIVTLHSPDIEFSDEVKNIDTTNLKLRIVGIVPLTSFSSDLDIQTSTPHISMNEVRNQHLGFYKKNMGVNNDFDLLSFQRNTTDNGYENSKTMINSFFGFRGLVSGAFWFDYIYEQTGGVQSGFQENIIAAFPVYPWHRNGSLNNSSYANEDGYRPAMLDKKKMSNLRFSYKTQYIHNNYIWEAYIENDDNNTGISGVSIFDSNEMSLVKIPAPKNSGLNSINYYGNVDKLVTWSKKSNKEGYPIIIAGTSNDIYNSNSYMFDAKYKILDSTWSENHYYSTEPVRIKYKSTPHAVLALNYTNGGYQKVLPTIEMRDTGELLNNSNSERTSPYFWDKNKSINGVKQDVITTGIVGNLSSIGVGGFNHGWLWLGELYNDNVINRFGGQTEDALENNLWVPCGESISIIDNIGNLKPTITILWTEGDTYYQRYDHIKTYPYTPEDQNSMVDIVSFMCETRVNIDGRYDRNRGKTSNLTITPENFNKINNVYSQVNNFFNYRTVNINKLNLDDFHNSLTWTKSKTAGEETDTWTNITLASTLDLDGDKGPLRALRRFNNNIIAFQDRGISNILYNENVQISSTEGVPIEIANSGKVSGKRYITSQVGCRNKWSICESPYGIYFVDDISKGIYAYDGSINNITTKLGFDSWIKKVSKLNIWDPKTFDSFITYYDKTNKEILFINKEDCLAYSEDIGHFTSFYSYEGTPYLATINDKTLTINKDNKGYYKIWLHNGGDYNMYYGKYKPFYTTIIVNPDINKDKIFNTLEFRSDSFNCNGDLLDTTFDTLNTWNEYQKGYIGLVGEQNKPSPIKRKFRIWRVNIPRDLHNHRDRMRNPWLYIKLSKEEENIDKTILHDMVVSYFE